MYTLQAIVADAATLAQGTVEKAHVLPMPQHMAMLPLVRTLRDKHNMPFLPFDDSDIKDPVSVIEAVVQSLGLTGRVVYLEAMFSGGIGYQASVVLEGGRSFGERLVSQDAINVALRAFGVEKQQSFDEFDALGLGECRDTEDWIP